MSNQRHPIHSRLGKLYVAADLLERNPELVMLALQDCLILSAGFDYATDRMQYVIASMSLGEHNPSCEPPLYNAHLTTANEGTEEEPKVVTRFIGFKKVEP